MQANFEQLIPKSLKELKDELKLLTGWVLAPRSEEFKNTCAYREEYEEKFWRQEDLKKLIAIEERRNVNIGEGVTVYFKTFNCYPYTVVRREENKLFIQQDTALIKDNSNSEHEPEYVFTQNPDFPICVAEWNENEGCFMYEKCRIDNGRKKVHYAAYNGNSNLLPENGSEYDLEYHRAS